MTDDNSVSLDDVFDPNSIGGDVEIEFEKETSSFLDQKSLEAFVNVRMSEGASEARVREAYAVLDNLRDVNTRRDMMGFLGADLIVQFEDSGLYEDCGFKNMATFIRSDLNPVGISTAYKYLKVGTLMKELPFGDVDFEREYCNQFGYTFDEVYDSDGNLDREKTIKNSSLVYGDRKDRVAYGRFLKIADAWDKSTISVPTAKELIHDAIQLSGQDFAVRLAEETGGKMPAAELLKEAGVMGGLHPFVNLSFPDRAENELKVVVEAVGEGRNFYEEVHGENGTATEIASKSVKFYLTHDGLVIADLKLASD